MERKWDEFLAALTALDEWAAKELGRVLELVMM
jgi:hypothetical protein